MKIDTMEDLFKAQLMDIYYAEKQLVRALPQMAQKATDEAVSDAFQTHAQETEEQIEKLEQVFEMLSIPPKGEKCEAMEGLLAEAKELMSDTQDEDVLNAALIAAAQKVEHYEIASYGTLAAIAKRLGYTNAADILGSILDQEKATDEKLTALAEDGQFNEMVFKAA